MKVLSLEAAMEDLREAVRYYDSVEPALGRSFRDEVRAAVGRIRRLPLAWQAVGDCLRRYLVHRFPYGIIYLMQEDEILIISVAHLHREPGHWKDRIFDNS